MTSTSPTPAVVVCATGERFEGFAYGSHGVAVGEAIAVSRGTGYQELLTGNQTSGKIVVFTSPHIGVTGVNDADAQGSKVQASGVIVRDPARLYSNFRAQRSLDDDLLQSDTVGACAVDTRALVALIRSATAPLRIGVFAGEDALLDPADQLSLVRATTEESA